MESTKMGIGWHQSSIDAPSVEFFAAIGNFPSSTKAKTIAILTALLICPHSCTVDIFTDSAATIANFEKVIIHKNNSTFRRLLKNQHIWI